MSFVIGLAGVTTSINLGRREAAGLREPSQQENINPYRLFKELFKEGVIIGLDNSILRLADNNILLN